MAEPLVFTIDMSGYDAVRKSADLVLDRSGSMVSFTAAGSQGITTKSFIRCGHSGEVWGVPGQTLAGAATLGGDFLVWTGSSESSALSNLADAQGQARVRSGDGQESPVECGSRGGLSCSGCLFFARWVGRRRSLWGGDAKPAAT